MSMVDETDSVNEKKSLYLTHIWYLEEQLDRCQLTHEELEKQNKELVSQYDTLKKNKAEKTKHLNELVGAQKKKVEELNQLKDQQLKSKQTQEALELQLKQEVLELIDQLHSQNRKLVANLEEKEEQLMVLKQQVSQQESLEEVLVCNPAVLEAAFNSLKIESDRDFDEDLAKRREPSVQAGNPSEESVPDRDQVELLTFLLSKRSALSEDREARQGRKKHLEASRWSLVKEVDTLTLQRSILHKQVQQVKHMFQQLFEERENHHMTQQCGQDEVKAPRQRLINLSKKYDQMVAQIGRIEAELQEETRRRRELEGMKQEAAIILRLILLGPEKPPETQWRIQRLLETLGTGPARTGSTLDSCTEQPHASEPKAVRELCHDEASISDPSEPARQPEASTSAECCGFQPSH